MLAALFAIASGRHSVYPVPVLTAIIAPRLLVSRSMSHKEFDTGRPAQRRSYFFPARKSRAEHVHTYIDLQIQPWYRRESKSIARRTSGSCTEPRAMPQSLTHYAEKIGPGHCLPAARITQNA